MRLTYKPQSLIQPALSQCAHCPGIHPVLLWIPTADWIFLGDGTDPVAAAFVLMRAMVWCEPEPLG